MIDIAIIGGGPAGMSAAINAAARNKKAVIFGKNPETSALWKAERVDNHLGMPSMTGKEMTEVFLSQVREKNIEFIEGRVLQLLDMGGSFTINCENQFYSARSLIFCTGISKGKKVSGEDEFVGKGVSYCATCDGMLYRNKTVLVVSETDEGIADANFLSEICEKVYFIGEKRDGLNDKIIVVNDKIQAVEGGNTVSSAVLESGKIEVSGIFFVKENIPLDSLIYGLASENGEITVNRNMETNIKGVFAAGDCAGKPYQLSKAIGEGLIAGQNAVKYIARS